MATIIGIYTRVAGVWTRCNGGTPIGFSGPATKVAGVWEGDLYVASKDTIWRPVWVNIDGEISIGDATAQDFDISPYNVACGFKWLGSGGIQRDNNGSGYVAYGSWRSYDCGRDYEIYFEHESAQVASGEPTLDTWLNLTDPDTDHNLFDSKSGSGFLNRWAYYDVRIREKVSAPAGGNDIANYGMNLEAET